MGTGFMIFRHEEITIFLVEHDILIRLQNKRPEPCNLQCVTNLVDLTKKANHCMRNEEYKQELESTQLN